MVVVVSAVSPGSQCGVVAHRFDQLDAGAVGLQPIRNVAPVVALREQVDDFHRRGDGVEGARDFLAVLATGLVGVRENNDTPTAEKFGEFWRPFGACAFACGGRHETDLGEIIAIFFAFADIGYGRLRCREEFRQPIRNPGARRLAFDPLCAVPVILRELLLAGAVAAFLDEKIRRPAPIVINVLSQHRPLGAGTRLAIFLLRLERREPELRSDMVATEDRIVAGKAVDKEAIGGVPVWLD